MARAVGGDLRVDDRMVDQRSRCRGDDSKINLALRTICSCSIVAVPRTRIDSSGFPIGVVSSPIHASPKRTSKMILSVAA